MRGLVEASSNLGHSITITPRVQYIPHPQISSIVISVDRQHNNNSNGKAMLILALLSQIIFLFYHEKK